LLVHELANNWSTYQSSNLKGLRTKISQLTIGLMDPNKVCLHKRKSCFWIEEGYNVNHISSYMTTVAPMLLCVRCLEIRHVSMFLSRVHVSPPSRCTWAACVTWHEHLARLMTRHRGGHCRASIWGSVDETA
jgi:hypothetical protein